MRRATQGPAYGALEPRSGEAHTDLIVSEPARHALYARLQEVLGGEHAETLMASLPHYPPADVATKADLARLEDRFDRLEDRFDRLEDRFDQLTRTFITTTVGAMIALTAIFGVIVAVFAR